MGGNDGSGSGSSSASDVSDGGSLPPPSGDGGVPPSGDDTVGNVVRNFNSERTWLTSIVDWFKGLFR